MFISTYIQRYKDINPRYGEETSNIDAVGIEAINSSIQNIIGTTIGERWGLPQFGSRLKYLMFELINEDTAGQIFRELITVIETWETRLIVVPEESSVIGYPDENLYQVAIIYRLRDSNIRGSFEATISG